MDFKYEVVCSSKKVITARKSSGDSTIATHEPIVFYRWPTMRHFWFFISRINIYQTSIYLQSCFYL